MIVYTSMFVYIFLIGYIGKAFINSKGIKTKYQNGVTMFLAVLVLAMPVFFIGMRTNYVDTKSYIEGFEALATDWGTIADSLSDSKGAGWIIYEWIIKCFITKDANVFLMITAIIQAGALLKLYYKYSIDYVYSILIFFLSCAFVNMMNGIRQFLAVALILYFVDWIFEKKYLKFILVVLVAISIHMSAIIWLPAVFLVQGKPWNRKTVLSSILILFAILFLDKFTNLLEDTLSSTAYSGYTAQFASDDGSSIMHTLIAAVPVLIAFIGRPAIADKNDCKANIMVNISLLGLMVNLLANFTSGILIGRMPIYFTLFNYALLPWLFENVFRAESKKLMRVFCIIGYGAYALYYMLNSWGSLGMPYISDILGINTWK